MSNNPKFKMILSVLILCIPATYVTGLRCYSCMPKEGNSTEILDCTNSATDAGKLQKCKPSKDGNACMLTSTDIDGETFYKRSCAADMEKYVGKCFDHVTKEEKIHSRTCFCAFRGCNENPDTLSSEGDPEIIYNISSKPSIKCYDCTIDTNTTKTVNDIPDCVVNEYNLGNVITCPSSNHFCMSVHVDNLDYKYTLRMCSISSRVPNGTCMNETIPEVGVRKVCTCSTDMCNAASRNNFLFILLLLMIFYSTIVFMLR